MNFYAGKMVHNLVSDEFNITSISHFMEIKNRLTAYRSIAVFWWAIDGSNPGHPD